MINIESKLILPSMNIFICLYWNCLGKKIEQCKNHCIWINVPLDIYLFPILSLFNIEYNFHHWKSVDPPLAASEVHQMLTLWRHIDNLGAFKRLNIFLLNMPWWIYQSFTIHAIEVIAIYYAILHSYTT